MKLTKVQLEQNVPPSKFVVGVCRAMGTINFCGLISDDYAPRIFDAIGADVAQDVWDSADRTSWNDDDVRLAVGRVLCERLGIEM